MSSIKYYTSLRNFDYKKTTKSYIPLGSFDYLKHVIMLSNEKLKRKLTTN